MEVSRMSVLLLYVDTPAKACFQAGVSAYKKMPSEACAHFLI